MKRTEEYSVSLNVNPTAIGYAVINDQYKIMQPVHHVDGYGVRLYREEQTKEDRRIARAARRSRKRENQRIKLLNKEFAPKINEIDSDFFKRLDQSGLSPRDKNKKYRGQFFEDPKEASYYGRKYPTIYHLEKDLAEGDDKKDIRLVYMALHALLTHRGHFYLPIPINQFKPGKIDTETLISTLNDNISETDIEFDMAHSDDIIDILINDNLANKDKLAGLKKVLLKPSKDKRRNIIATQVANALVGRMVDWAKLFDVEDADKAVWSFKLSDPELDEKLDILSANLDSDQLAVVNVLHETYDAVVLADILRGSSNLPDAEIAIYDKHKKDIGRFRDYIDNYCNDEDKEKLDLAYSLYIKHLGKNEKKLNQAKHYFNSRSKLNPQDFYKIIKDQIKKSKVKLDQYGQELVEYINHEIDSNFFLPKQRNLRNALIPYQLNAITFNKILEHQGKYYPFLVKKNPVSKNIKNAPYKLSQLFVFTIPHYVGPLSTREDQIKSGIPKDEQHAWMIRKENGPITPWNFEQKIDLVATANKFIRELTATDTYLLNEQVLPASSLIYQKYTVLDELSNIKLNHKPLGASLKQNIFNDLFKKTKTVTRAKLLKYLKQHNHVVTTLTGFADPKKFNSSYSTYIDYQKIFGKKIDDPKLQDDFEKMIEWSTIFTDKDIFATKLKEIPWLSEEETTQVLHKKFNGWGRFSKQLLTGIKAKINDNVTGSILEAMWITADGFNHWRSQPQFKTLIDKHNVSVSKRVNSADIIDKAFTSPKNKKAVRQAIKVLTDITSHYKQAPKRIILNATKTREDQDESMLAREQIIRKAYRKNKRNALFSEELTDNLATIKKRLMTTKEYLYFQQLGRDALTGGKINFEQLWKYRVVHIIPRSQVPDESLDNKILVSQATYELISQGKAAHEFASDKRVDNNASVAGLWSELNTVGLISKYKNYLLRVDPYETDKDNAWSIIRKQLTASSQSLSLLTEILASVYPESEIITIKEDQIQQMRYIFDWYSLPAVNDFHHAMDAFLGGIAGIYFDLEYPSLKPIFVYGDNRPILFDSEENQKLMTSLKSTNLLWRILYGKDDKIISKDGTTVAVESKEKLIKYINKVYNWKYANVSVQSLTAPNILFNATMYPRLERDTASKRTLIPLKKDHPVDIYGGYSSTKVNQLALLNIEKVDGTHQHLIYGIKTIWQSALSKLSGDAYYEKLHNMFYKTVMTGKSGKVSKKIKSFQILKAPIATRQIVKIGKNHVLLATPQYYYPVDQLYLDNVTRKQLMDYVYDPEFIHHRKTKDVAEGRRDTSLRNIIEDIIYNVIPNDYPIFGDTTINKIQTAYKKYGSDLSTKDRAEVIKTLLLLLHANLSLPGIKQLHINSINLQVQNIKLEDNTAFIYTSPSGIVKKQIII